MVSVVAKPEALAPRVLPYKPHLCAYLGYTTIDPDHLAPWAHGAVIITKFLSRLGN